MGTSSVTAEGTTRLVADAFATCLDAPDVTAGSDFFALGGNSLLAAAVVARLRAATGVKVAIRDLFRTPTVAGLASVLDERLGSGGAAGGSR